MSHLPKYKFYLKKDALTYYKSVNGVVSTTAVATPLSMSPIGWKDTMIKWTRNIKYMGLGRLLSTTYNFVRDGKEILRKVKYTEGIEGKCTLVIYILNDADWTYSLFISCPIDFKESKDKDVYFSANLLDNSVEAKIKANETTPIEIDCDVASNPSVKLDGITLQGTYRYAPQDAEDDYHHEAQTPLFFTTKEGEFPVVETGDQAYLESFEISSSAAVGAVWSDSMYNSPCRMLKAKTACSIRISAKHKIGIRRITVGTDAIQLVQLLLIVDKNKTVIQRAILYFSPILSVIAGSYIEFEATYAGGYYDVPAGAQVYLITRVAPFAPAGYVRTTFFGNADLADPNPLYYINLDIKFRFPYSYAPALNYYIFYDRLMKKMLGSTSTVSYSSFLRQLTGIEDNVPYFTQVTCGDAIRGFDTAKIRTTFSDMFRDASKRWMLGFGFDNTGLAVLESLFYFLDKDTIICDLGAIKDMEISNATELMFNKVDVGQDIQTYDNLNGRDEYNTKTSYKLPLDSITNDADWVSKYRADPTGIEEYRMNLSQKKTTDSESDNDTFILSTTSGLFHDELRRPSTMGGSVTGVYDSVGAYNVDLTAARTMKRNKALLASINHLRNGQNITFQTSDKNQNLQSNFGSSRPTIIENANIPVNDLGTPLFYPLFFKFTAIVPRNLFALMASFSKGCMRFKYRNTLYKGYPWDVATTPAHDSSYEFQLLSTPDNDLTKLYS